MIFRPNDRLHVTSPDVPRACRQDLLETALAGLLPIEQRLERLFDRLERRA